MGLDRGRGLNLVNGPCRDGARSKSGVSRVEVEVEVESRAGTGSGPKRGSVRARTSPGYGLGSGQGRGLCLLESGHRLSRLSVRSEIKTGQA